MIKVKKMDKKLFRKLENLSNLYSSILPIAEKRIYTYLRFQICVLWGIFMPNQKSANRTLKLVLKLLT